ncbi:MAG: hypothetical protein K2F57_05270, partial [Candidatus Gastranaerophilales bacterium]|nr:hypothetical protein [Candidatus Gastranaerophilales bacterium]
ACSVVAEACAKIPVIGQLAGPALAGVTAFLLTKGVTDDVFAGANAEKVLDNIGVAKKEAQPVLKQIKDMEITGDPKRDAAIKAAVIKAGIGEDTKACNLRELQSVLSDLEKTKDAIGKIEVKQNQNDTDTDIDVDTDTDTDIDTDTDTDTDNDVEPTKIRGWDRDHGLLQKHGKVGLESNPDGKKNVQIIIGDAKITGDYEKPDTIEIKDNTDGKENTFTYRKLTDEEVEKGQLADGTKLTGLDGKNGPFYLMTEAKDDKGNNIKRNTVEVKQLELQKSEDGKTYDYRLEQYEGMNGYNDRSVNINNNAKGTAPVQQAKKKVGTQKTAPAAPKQAPAKTFKLSNGAVLRPTDNANVFYDDAHKMHYRKNEDGKFVSLPDVKQMGKNGSWIDKQGKSHPATDIPKAGKLPNYNKPAAP